MHRRLRLHADNQYTERNKKAARPCISAAAASSLSVFVFIAFLCTSLYLYDFFQIVKTFQYIIAHCLYFLSRLYFIRNHNHCGTCTKRCPNTV